MKKSCPSIEIILACCLSRRTSLPNLKITFLYIEIHGVFSSLNVEFFRPLSRFCKINVTLREVETKRVCLGSRKFKRKTFEVWIQSSGYKCTFLWWSWGKQIRLWTCSTFLFLAFTLFSQHLHPSVTLTPNAFVWNEVSRATTDQRHLEEHLAKETLPA